MIFLYAQVLHITYAERQILGLLVLDDGSLFLNPMLD